MTRPIRVLVVEDDEDTRELILEVLAAAACVARGVASAEAAMAAVEERAPDVIVTDLVLGHGASGWTLAEALREQPATAHIALVAVSGRVDPDWKIVRAFDAYLPKPVEIDALVTLVRQLGAVARSGPHAITRGGSSS